MNMYNTGKRICLEKGKILGKRFEDAREKRIINGVEYPAKEKQYICLVISSSYPFDKDNGFIQPTIVDYKVSEDDFNKIKFGTNVKVEFEYSQFKGANKYIPISLSIIDKE